MNNFYIVTNVTKDKSLETTDYIEKYLTEHGRHVTVMVRGGIEKGCRKINICCRSHRRQIAF